VRVLIRVLPKQSKKNKGHDDIVGQRTPRDLDSTLVVNVSKRYSQPNVVLPTFTPIHHVLTPKIPKQRRVCCHSCPIHLSCTFLLSFSGICAVPHGRRRACHACKYGSLSSSCFIRECWANSGISPLSDSTAVSKAEAMIVCRGKAHKPREMCRFGPGIRRTKDSHRPRIRPCWPKNNHERRRYEGGSANRSWKSNVRRGIDQGGIVVTTMRAT